MYTEAHVRDYERGAEWTEFYLAHRHDEVVWPRARLIDELAPRLGPVGELCRFLP